MKSKNSQSTTILFIGLIAMNLWLLWGWSSSRSEALRAKSRLDKIDNIAQQIEQLRIAPVRAELATRSDDSLAQLIEKAIQSAGLRNNVILNIGSGTLHYLGDSPYKQQTTVLNLGEAKLDQFTKLALSITKNDPGILVPKITFHAPYGITGNESQELWKAEMTLTSRIYAPKSGPAK